MALAKHLVVEVVFVVVKKNTTEIKLLKEKQGMAKNKKQKQGSLINYRAGGSLRDSDVFSVLRRGKDRPYLRRIKCSLIANKYVKQKNKVDFLT